MVRPVEFCDAYQIIEIYNYYIIYSSITFEELEINSDEMIRRINKIISDLPWLVFSNGKEMLGYACATPWKHRSAYRYSVELSVYVKNGVQEMGIGSILYTELISQFKKSRNSCYHGRKTLTQ